MCRHNTGLGFEPVGFGFFFHPFLPFFFPPSLWFSGLTTSSGEGRVGPQHLAFCRRVGDKHVSRFSSGDGEEKKEGKERTGTLRRGEDAQADRAGAAEETDLKHRVLEVRAAVVAAKAGGRRLGTDIGVEGVGRRH